MEEEIELIRIESIVDGWGVFRSNHRNTSRHSKFREINERHNSFLFPTPWEDSEIKTYFKYDTHLFGFLSLAQFNIAFTNSIKVSKGHKSKYQVIYNPEDIIEKTDISYLFL